MFLLPKIHFLKLTILYIYSVRFPVNVPNSDLCVRENPTFQGACENT
jgi:hypothetical protein